MNTDVILNALLEKALDDINAGLPAVISGAGLDPWKTVAKDKCNAGTVNLGICKATAKAEFKLTNMKGLASMVVRSAVASDTHRTAAHEVAGRLTVKGKLKKELECKVAGKCRAGCKGAELKASIKGKAFAERVEAKGVGDFRATIDPSTGCITRMKLDDLQFSYGSAWVKIDGLGALNSCLKPIEKEVLKLFETIITRDIAKAVKPELNRALEACVPYCMELDLIPGSGVATPTVPVPLP